MWTVHFLDARGRLSPFRADIADAVQAVCVGLAGDCPAADVVVRASDVPMPPSLAVYGGTYGPGRIELVLEVAALAPGSATLRDQLLQTLWHEAHHLMRWDGPGYGQTLGEALVSEGLAQVFVHERMDCPPEPWEVAVSPEGCEAFREAARAGFDDAGYDHEAWFFGAGDMPDALGYALGRLIVLRALAAAPGTTAQTLAHKPAAWFRAALDAPFAGTGADEQMLTKG